MWNKWVIQLMQRLDQRNEYVCMYESNHRLPLVRPACMVERYGLEVESSWNVMAHSDAREGKWRGNWRMEWVASTLHTTSELGVSSITTITTANAHTLVASSQLNWRSLGAWFKWTRPFRRKMRSRFCACAITFKTQSTHANAASDLIYEILETLN